MVKNIENVKNLFSLPRYVSAVEEKVPARIGGKVSQLVGLTVEAYGISAPVGTSCHIFSYQNGNSSNSPTQLPFLEEVISRNRNGKGVKAEIVGFQEDKALLMPLGTTEGIGPGSIVKVENHPFSVKVGDELLGRVLGGLGQPLDEKGELAGGNGSSSLKRRPVHNSTPNPTSRRRIDQPIATGVKAIDGLLTCGRGQRMGIFSGSGVGKSILIGMIARNTNADVNVIALIGERGREVREFIEDSLGEEGLKRSVVVVSTSDEPALVRIKGAFTAITIAEYFRDKGMDVMFIMDSVTRLAMAKREIGLAIGEPPTTKGYTPSVFSMLPKFLERAGTTGHDGSITGFYTVLMEADDLNDPVVDNVRAILDGHIVLSRDLAEQNHYPAIDVLQSVSRLFPNVATKEHRQAAAEFKELLSVYEDARDLINIGAYEQGNNPKIDRSIKYIDDINSYLRQDILESADFQSSVQKLIGLVN